MTVPALELDVSVEPVLKGGRYHPIATITVTNRSPGPVAFSETFGITNRPWLSFEIRVDGERIYYPTEIDAFLESPTYLCLRPGEKKSREIDLLNWRVSWGGELSERAYQFELMPGKLSLRAHYSD